MLELSFLEDSVQHDKLIDDYTNDIEQMDIESAEHYLNDSKKEIRLATAEDFESESVQSMTGTTDENKIILERKQKLSESQERKDLTLTFSGIDSNITSDSGTMRHCGTSPFDTTPKEKESDIPSLKLIIGRKEVKTKDATAVSESLLTLYGHQDVEISITSESKICLTTDDHSSGRKSTKHTTEYITKTTDIKNDTKRVRIQRTSEAVSGGEKPTEVNFSKLKSIHIYQSTDSISESPNSDQSFSQPNISDTGISITRGFTETATSPLTKSYSEEPTSGKRYKGIVTDTGLDVEIEELEMTDAGLSPIQQDDITTNISTTFPTDDDQINDRTYSINQGTSPVDFDDTIDTSEAGTLTDRVEFKDASLSPLDADSSVKTPISGMTDDEILIKRHGSGDVKEKIRLIEENAKLSQKIMSPSRKIVQKESQNIEEIPRDVTDSAEIIDEFIKYEKVSTLQTKLSHKDIDEERCDKKKEDSILHAIPFTAKSIAQPDRPFKLDEVEKQIVVQPTEEEIHSKKVTSLVSTIADSKDAAKLSDELRQIDEAVCEKVCIKRKVSMLKEQFEQGKIDKKLSEVTSSEDFISKAELLPDNKQKFDEETSDQIDKTITFIRQEQHFSSINKALREPISSVIKRDSSSISSETVEAEKSEIKFPDNKTTLSDEFAVPKKVSELKEKFERQSSMQDKLSELLLTGDNKIKAVKDSDKEEKNTSKALSLSTKMDSEELGSLEQISIDYTDSLSKVAEFIKQEQKFSAQIEPPIKVEPEVVISCESDASPEKKSDLISKVGKYTDNLNIVTPTTIDVDNTQKPSVASQLYAVPFKVRAEQKIERSIDVEDIENQVISTDELEQKKVKKIDKIETVIKQEYRLKDEKPLTLANDFASEEVCVKHTITALAEPSQELIVNQTDNDILENLKYRESNEMAAKGHGDSLKQITNFIKAEQILSSVLKETEKDSKTTHTNLQLYATPFETKSRPQLEREVDIATLESLIVLDNPTSEDLKERESVMKKVAENKYEMEPREDEFKQSIENVKSFILAEQKFSTIQKESEETKIEKPELSKLHTIPFEIKQKTQQVREVDISELENLIISPEDLDLNLTTDISKIEKKEIAQQDTNYIPEQLCMKRTVSSLAVQNQKALQESSTTECDEDYFSQEAREATKTSPCVKDLNYPLKTGTDVITSGQKFSSSIDLKNQISKIKTESDDKLSEFKATKDPQHISTELSLGNISDFIKREQIFSSDLQSKVKLNKKVDIREELILPDTLKASTIFAESLQEIAQFIETEKDYCSLQKTILSDIYSAKHEFLTESNIEETDHEGLETLIKEEISSTIPIFEKCHPRKQEPTSAIPFKPTHKPDIAKNLNVSEIEKCIVETKDIQTAQILKKDSSPLKQDEKQELTYSDRGDTSNESSIKEVILIKQTITPLEEDKTSSSSPSLPSEIQTTVEFHDLKLITDVEAVPKEEINTMEDIPIINPDPLVQNLPLEDVFKKHGMKKSISQILMDQQSEENKFLPAKEPSFATEELSDKLEKDFQKDLFKTIETTSTSQHGKNFENDFEKTISSLPDKTVTLTSTSTSTLSRVRVSSNIRQEEIITWKPKNKTLTESDITSDPETMPTIAPFKKKYETHITTITQREFPSFDELLKDSIGETKEHLPDSLLYKDSTVKMNDQNIAVSVVDEKVKSNESIRKLEKVNSDDTLDDTNGKKVYQTTDPKIKQSLNIAEGSAEILNKAPQSLTGELSSNINKYNLIDDKVDLACIRDDNMYKRDIEKPSLVSKTDINYSVTEPSIIPANDVYMPIADVVHSNKKDLESITEKTSEFIDKSIGTTVNLEKTKHILGDPIYIGQTDHTLTSPIADSLGKALHVLTDPMSVVNEKLYLPVDSDIRIEKKIIEKTSATEKPLLVHTVEESLETALQVLSAPVTLIKKDSHGFKEKEDFSLLSQRKIQENPAETAPIIKKHPESVAKTLEKSMHVLTDPVFLDEKTDRILSYYNREEIDRRLGLETKTQEKPIEKNLGGKPLQHIVKGLEEALHVLTDPASVDYTMTHIATSQSLKEEIDISHTVELDDHKYPLDDFKEELDKQHKPVSSDKREEKGVTEKPALTEKQTKPDKDLMAPLDDLKETLDEPKKPVVFVKKEDKAVLHTLSVIEKPLKSAIHSQDKDLPRSPEKVHPIELGDHKSPLDDLKKDSEKPHKPVIPDKREEKGLTEKPTLTEKQTKPDKDLMAPLDDLKETLDETKQPVVSDKKEDKAVLDTPSVIDKPLKSVIHSPEEDLTMSPEKVHPIALDDQSPLDDLKKDSDKPHKPVISDKREEKGITEKPALTEKQTKPDKDLMAPLDDLKETLDEPKQPVVPDKKEDKAVTDTPSVIEKQLKSVIHSLDKDLTTSPEKVHPIELGDHKSPLDDLKKDSEKQHKPVIPDKREEKGLTEKPTLTEKQTKPDKDLMAPLDDLKETLDETKQPVVSDKKEDKAVLDTPSVIDKPLKSVIHIPEKDLTMSPDKVHPIPLGHHKSPLDDLKKDSDKPHKPVIFDKREEKGVTEKPAPTEKQTKPDKDLMAPLDDLIETLDEPNKSVLSHKKEDKEVLDTPPVIEKPLKSVIHSPDKGLTISPEMVHPTELDDHKSPLDDLKETLDEPKQPVVSDKKEDKAVIDTPSVIEKPLKSVIHSPDKDSTISPEKVHPTELDDHKSPLDDLKETLDEPKQPVVSDKKEDKAVIDTPSVIEKPLKSVIHSPEKDLTMSPEKSHPIVLDDHKYPFDDLKEESDKPHKPVVSDKREEKGVTEKPALSEKQTKPNKDLMSPLDDLKETLEEPKQPVVFDKKEDKAVIDTPSVIEKPLKSVIHSPDKDLTISPEKVHPTELDDHKSPLDDLKETLYEPKQPVVSDKKEDKAVIDTPSVIEKPLKSVIHSPEKDLTMSPEKSHPVVLDDHKYPFDDLKEESDKPHKPVVSDKREEKGVTEKPALFDKQTKPDKDLMASLGDLIKTLDKPKKPVVSDKKEDKAVLDTPSVIEKPLKSVIHSPDKDLTTSPEKVHPTVLDDHKSPLDEFKKDSDKPHKPVIFDKREEKRVTEKAALTDKQTKPDKDLMASLGDLKETLDEPKQPVVSDKKEDKAVLDTPSVIEKPLKSVIHSPDKDLTISPEEVHPTELEDHKSPLDDLKKDSDKPQKPVIFDKREEKGVTEKPALTEKQTKPDKDLMAPLDDFKETLDEPKQPVVSDKKEDKAVIDTPSAMGKPLKSVLHSPDKDFTISPEKMQPIELDDHKSALGDVKEESDSPHKPVISDKREEKGITEKPALTEKQTKPDRDLMAPLDDLKETLDEPKQPVLSDKKEDKAVIDTPSVIDKPLKSVIHSPDKDLTMSPEKVHPIELDDHISPFDDLKEGSDKPHKPPDKDLMAPFDDLKETLDEPKQHVLSDKKEDKAVIDTSSAMGKPLKSVLHSSDKDLTISPEKVHPTELDDLKSPLDDLKKDSDKPQKPVIFDKRLEKGVTEEPALTEKQTKPDKDLMAPLDDLKETLDKPKQPVVSDKKEDKAVIDTPSVIEKPLKSVIHSPDKNLTMSPEKVHPIELDDHISPFDDLKEGSDKPHKPPDKDLMAPLDDLKETLEEPKQPVVSDKKEDKAVIDTPSVIEKPLKSVIHSPDKDLTISLEKVHPTELDDHKSPLDDLKKYSDKPHKPVIFVKREEKGVTEKQAPTEKQTKPHKDLITPLDDLIETLDEPKKPVVSHKKEDKEVIDTPSVIEKPLKSVIHRPDKDLTISPEKVHPTELDDHKSPLDVFKKDSHKPHKPVIPDKKEEKGVTEKAALTDKQTKSDKDLMASLGDLKETLDEPKHPVVSDQKEDKAVIDTPSVTEKPLKSVIHSPDKDLTISPEEVHPTELDDHKSPLDDLKKDSDKPHKPVIFHKREEKGVTEKPALTEKQSTPDKDLMAPLDDLKETLDEPKQPVVSDKKEDKAVIDTPSVIEKPLKSVIHSPDKDLTMSPEKVHPIELDDHKSPFDDLKEESDKPHKPVVSDKREEKGVTEKPAPTEKQTKPDKDLMTPLDDLIETLDEPKKPVVSYKKEDKEVIDTPLVIEKPFKSVIHSPDKDLTISPEKVHPTELDDHKSPLDEFKKDSDKPHKPVIFDKREEKGVTEKPALTDKQTKPDKDLMASLGDLKETLDEPKQPVLSDKKEDKAVIDTPSVIEKPLKSVMHSPDKDLTMSPEKVHPIELDDHKSPLGDVKEESDKPHKPVIPDKKEEKGVTEKPALTDKQTKPDKDLMAPLDDLKETLDVPKQPVVSDKKEDKAVIYTPSVIEKPLKSVMHSPDKDLTMSPEKVHPIELDDHKSPLVDVKKESDKPHKPVIPDKKEEKGVTQKPALTEKQTKPDKDLMAPLDDRKETLDEPKQPVLSDKKEDKAVIDTPSVIEKPLKSVIHSPEKDLTMSPEKVHPIELDDHISPFDDLKEWSDKPHKPVIPDKKEEKGVTEKPAPAEKQTKPDKDLMAPPDDLKETLDEPKQPVVSDKKEDKAVIDTPSVIEKPLKFVIHSPDKDLIMSPEKVHPIELDDYISPFDDLKEGSDKPHKPVIPDKKEEKGVTEKPALTDKQTKPDKDLMAPLGDLKETLDEPNQPVVSDKKEDKAVIDTPSVIEKPLKSVIHSPDKDLIMSPEKVHPIELDDYISPFDDLKEGSDKPHKPPDKDLMAPLDDLKETLDEPKQPVISDKKEDKAVIDTPSVIEKPLKSVIHSPDKNLTISPEKVHPIELNDHISPFDDLKEGSDKPHKPPDKDLMAPLDDLKETLDEPKQPVVSDKKEDKAVIDAPSVIEKPLKFVIHSPDKDLTLSPEKVHPIELDDHKSPLGDVKEESDKPHKPVIPDKKEEKGVTEKPALTDKQTKPDKDLMAPLDDLKETLDEPKQPVVSDKKEDKAVIDTPSVIEKPLKSVIHSPEKDLTMSPEKVHPIELDDHISPFDDLKEGLDKPHKPPDKDLMAPLDDLKETLDEPKQPVISDKKEDKAVIDTPSVIEKPLKSVIHSPEKDLTMSPKKVHPIELDDHISPFDDLKEWSDKPHKPPDKDLMAPLDDLKETLDEPKQPVVSDKKEDKAVIDTPSVIEKPLKFVIHSPDKDLTMSPEKVHPMELDDHKSALGDVKKESDKPHKPVIPDKKEKKGVTEKPALTDKQTKPDKDLMAPLGDLKETLDEPNQPVVSDKKEDKAVIDTPSVIEKPLKFVIHSPDKDLIMSPEKVHPIELDDHISPFDDLKEWSDKPHKPVIPDKKEEKGVTEKPAPAEKQTKPDKDLMAPPDDLKETLDEPKQPVVSDKKEDKAVIDTPSVIEKPLKFVIHSPDKDLIMSPEKVHPIELDDYISPFDDLKEGSDKPHKPVIPDKKEEKGVTEKPALTDKQTKPDKDLMAPLGDLKETLDEPNQPVVSDKKEDKAVIDTPSVIEKPLKSVIHSPDKDLIMSPEKVHPIELDDYISPFDDLKEGSDKPHKPVIPDKKEEKGETLDEPKQPVISDKKEDKAVIDTPSVIEKPLKSVIHSPDKNLTISPEKVHPIELNDHISPFDDLKEGSDKPHKPPDKDLMAPLDDLKETLDEPKQPVVSDKKEDKAVIDAPSVIEKPLKFVIHSPDKDLTLSPEKVHPIELDDHKSPLGDVKEESDKPHKPVIPDKKEEKGVTEKPALTDKQTKPDKDLMAPLDDLKETLDEPKQPVVSDKKEDKAVIDTPSVIEKPLKSVIHSPEKDLTMSPEKVHPIELDDHISPFDDLKEGLDKPHKPPDKDLMAPLDDLKETLDEPKQPVISDKKEDKAVIDTPSVIEKPLKSVIHSPEKDLTMSPEKVHPIELDDHISPFDDLKEWSDKPHKPPDKDLMAPLDDLKETLDEPKQPVVSDKKEDKAVIDTPSVIEKPLKFVIHSPDKDLTMSPEKVHPMELDDHKSALGDGVTEKPALTDKQTKPDKDLMAPLGDLKETLDEPNQPVVSDKKEDKAVIDTPSVIEKPLKSVIHSPDKDLIMSPEKVHPIELDDYISPFDDLKEGSDKPHKPPDKDLMAPLDDLKETLDEPKQPVISDKKEDKAVIDTPSVIEKPLKSVIHSPDKNLTISPEKVHPIELNDHISPFDDLKEGSDKPHKPPDKDLMAPLDDLKETLDEPKQPVVSDKKEDKAVIDAPSVIEKPLKFVIHSPDKDLTLSPEKVHPIELDDHKSPLGDVKEESDKPHKPVIPDKKEEKGDLMAPLDDLKETLDEPKQPVVSDKKEDKAVIDTPSVIEKPLKSVIHSPDKDLTISPEKVHPIELDDHISPFDDLKEGSDKPHKPPDKDLMAPLDDLKETLDEPKQPVVSDKKEDKAVIDTPSVIEKPLKSVIHSPDKDLTMSPEKVHPIELDDHKSALVDVKKESDKPHKPVIPDKKEEKGDLMAPLGDLKETLDEPKQPVVSDKKEDKAVIDTPSVIEKLLKSVIHSPDKDLTMSPEKVHPIELDDHISPFDDLKEGSDKPHKPPDKDLMASLDGLKEILDEPKQPVVSDKKEDKAVIDTPSVIEKPLKSVKHSPDKDLTMSSEKVYPIELDDHKSPLGDVKKESDRPHKPPDKDLMASLNGLKEILDEPKQPVVSDKKEDKAVIDTPSVIEKPLKSVIHSPDKDITMSSEKVYPIELDDHKSPLGDLKEGSDKPHKPPDKDLMASLDGLKEILDEPKQPVVSDKKEDKAVIDTPSVIEKPLKSVIHSPDKDLTMSSEKVYPIELDDHKSPPGDVKKESDRPHKPPDKDLMAPLDDLKETLDEPKQPVISDKKEDKAVIDTPSVIEKPLKSVIHSPDKDLTISPEKVHPIELDDHISPFDDLKEGSDKPHKPPDKELMAPLDDLKETLDEPKQPVVSDKKEDKAVIDAPSVIEKPLKFVIHSPDKDLTLSPEKVHPIELDDHKSPLGDVKEESDKPHKPVIPDKKEEKGVTEKPTLTDKQTKPDKDLMAPLDDLKETLDEPKQPVVSYKKEDKAVIDTPSVIEKPLKSVIHIPDKDLTMSPEKVHPIELDDHISPFDDLKEGSDKPHKPVIPDKKEEKGDLMAPLDDLKETLDEPKQPVVSDKKEDKAVIDTPSVIEKPLKSVIHSPDKDLTISPEKVHPIELDDHISPFDDLKEGSDKPHKPVIPDKKEEIGVTEKPTLTDKQTKPDKDLMAPLDDLKETLDEPKQPVVSDKKEDKAVIDTPSVIEKPLKSVIHSPDKDLTMSPEKVHPIELDDHKSALVDVKKESDKPHKPVIPDKKEEKGVTDKPALTDKQTKPDKDLMAPLGDLKETLDEPKQPVVSDKKEDKAVIDTPSVIEKPLKSVIHSPDKDLIMSPEKVHPIELDDHISPFDDLKEGSDKPHKPPDKDLMASLDDLKEILYEPEQPVVSDKKEDKAGIDTPSVIEIPLKSVIHSPEKDLIKSPEKVHPIELDAHKSPLGDVKEESDKPHKPVIPDKKEEKGVTEKPALTDKQTKPDKDLMAPLGDLKETLDEPKQPVVSDKKEDKAVTDTPSVIEKPLKSVIHSPDKDLTISPEKVHPIELDDHISPFDDLKEGSDKPHKPPDKELMAPLDDLKETLDEPKQPVVSDKKEDKAVIDAPSVIEKPLKFVIHSPDKDLTLSPEKVHPIELDDHKSPLGDVKEESDKPHKPVIPDKKEEKGVTEKPTLTDKQTKPDKDLMAPLDDLKETLDEPKQPVVSYKKEDKAVIDTPSVIEKPLKSVIHIPDKDLTMSPEKVHPIELDDHISPFDDLKEGSDKPHKPVIPDKKEEKGVTEKPTLTDKQTKPDKDLMAPLDDLKETLDEPKQPVISDKKEDKAVIDTPSVIEKPLKSVIHSPDKDLTISPEKVHPIELDDHISPFDDLKEGSDKPHKPVIPDKKEEIGVTEKPTLTDKQTKPDKDLMAPLDDLKETLDEPKQPVVSDKKEDKAVIDTPSVIEKPLKCIL
ncbi:titin-like [Condylostylus longicornis]|uniref:titin-like n=1 Tax=Condylostylus longicornis TaxID=2530218 RepID=UPI00244DE176|nr:titin-like [Condylostylus longicornis]